MRSLCLFNIYIQEFFVVLYINLTCYHSIKYFIYCIVIHVIEHLQRMGRAPRLFPLPIHTLPHQQPPLTLSLKPHIADCLPIPPHIITPCFPPTPE